LTKSSSGFVLTDPSGDQVHFTAANSSTPSRYTPSQVTQPGSSRSVGFIYDAASTDAAYGKPLLMVAPDPNLAAGTSSTTACPYPASASTWSAGCRGLQFAYNSGGKLTQVSFVSYDGSTLTNTPVAAYSYDSTGRLIGEWDPRISPNLVTTYTYNENSSSPTYGWLTSTGPAQESGSGALAPWTFTYNTTSGSPDYGKLISVTRTHSNGTSATQTIAYEVPLTTAAGGPVTMNAATVGTWNQTDVPASAAATFPATHVPSNPPTASDWQYAEITYYDADGRQVNTADYGSGAWNITTTQYDGYGDVISQLSAADRAEALAAGSSSASVAAELETVSEYTTAADGSQQLTDTYGPLHKANVPGQGTQQVRTHTHYLYDQGAPTTGGPYDLVTTQTETASLGAGIPGTSDTDARTIQSVYNNGTDDTGWTLRNPLHVITDPGGLAITHTAVYNEDPTLYGGEPLLVKTCLPSDTSCSGAGTQQTIYYTAGSNPVDSACGNKPTWADLACKTQPAAQPSTSGLPNMPVTTYTYNTYLQTLTKTENFGNSTRTTTYTYDAAGRQTRVSIATSGSGMSTPVNDQVTVYSPSTA
jgi:YD repeat-containing protein